MSAQTYTPDEAFNKIRTAVTGKGEESGRNTVMRALAAVNYRSAPRVIEGRHDGSNFRIYHWSGTPMGDILLVGGASVETDLIHGSELADTPKAGMIYVAGSVAGGKTMDKVQAYLQSKAVTRQAAKAQEAGMPRTTAASPRPRAAAASRKPAESGVEVKPAPRGARKTGGAAHKPDAEAYRRQMEAEEAERRRRQRQASGEDLEAVSGAGATVESGRRWWKSEQENEAIRQRHARMLAGKREREAEAERRRASSAAEKSELVGGLKDLMKELGL